MYCSEKMTKQTQTVQRQRKVDPAPLFWTLVLGFSQGGMRRVATLRRLYQSLTGCTLAESSFYDRFKASLVRFLKGALQHALDQALELVDP